MADRQIRRLPVLDRDGQLSGILAMADLAVERKTREDAGKALEGISEPARPRRSES